MMINLDPVERKLFDAFKDIEVIDAHEHLAPEEERIKSGVDIVCLLAWPYTGTDLMSSGMPQETTDLEGWGRYSSKTYLKLINTKIPLKERWSMISPYLKNIRYGSYARAVYLSIKEFYGFDEINDENYEEISDAMRKANKPGIYRKILREKCNIRTALTQAGRTDYDMDLLIPLMPGFPWCDVYSKKQIEEREKYMGCNARNLDDYLQMIESCLKQWKDEGVVGVKIRVRPLVESDKRKASSLFKDIIRDPKRVLPDPNPLQSYLYDEMLEMCAAMDLVVAVHTGMWGDFRKLNPLYIIPLLVKHPNTKFDIYHMGMPWVRETGIIGKNFPNAWLNLCWSHVISPRMAMSALDEWIDLVPVNKIIAFGGDYGSQSAECIYGHLHMAKENIARVLGERIKDGLMSMKDAVSLAEEWFYNVPRELYNL